MRYLVTLHDESNIESLAAYADGFLIGNNEFAHGLTTSFSINSLNEMISKIKAMNKEVYLIINKMLTDNDLELLHQFLSKINIESVNGFIFSDIGALFVLDTLGIKKKGVYNPETLLTNYFDFNYLKSDNIKGAYVSKEITLSDILEIGKKKEYQLFYFGHGNLLMFYSKRMIIQSYTDYMKKENIYHNKKNLSMTEEMRQDENLRILEDDLGFHVYRGNVFSSYNDLDSLRSVVDYFVIDSTFYNDQYTLDTLKMYNNEISIDEVSEKYNQTIYDGFLHKKTVYKGKIDD